MLQQMVRMFITDYCSNLL